MYVCFFGGVTSARVLNMREEEEEIFTHEEIASSAVKFASHTQKGYFDNNS